MSDVKNNFCCTSSCDHENKFVIMVDDTKDCEKPVKCHQSIQGIPIHEVFIDLSDCKNQGCKQEKCKEKELCKTIDEKKDRTV